MALDQKRKWTFEEYQERPDDLLFAELVDGELVVTPAPLERHQHLVMELAFAVRLHLQAQPLGRLGDGGRYGNPQVLEAGDTLTSALLPGFALAIADLYAGLSDAEEGDEA